MWEWMADRRRYMILNLALLIVMIGSALTVGQPGVVLPVCMVVWNAVSLPRIADQRRWWCQLAPYATVAALVLVYLGVLESAGNGPWVIGYVPTPWWHTVLTIAAIPFTLAWPVAAFQLATLPDRQKVAS